MTCTYAKLIQKLDCVLVLGIVEQLVGKLQLFSGHFQVL